MFFPATPASFEYAAMLQGGGRITDPGPDIFPFDPVGGRSRLVIYHNGQILEWRGRTKFRSLTSNRWWITKPMWPCPGQWELWDKARRQIQEAKRKRLDEINESVFWKLTGGFSIAIGSIVFAAATAGSGATVSWGTFAMGAGTAGKAIQTAVSRQKMIEGLDDLFKDPPKPKCPRAIRLGKTYIA